MTGATGFVGKAVAQCLQVKPAFNLRSAVRNLGNDSLDHEEKISAIECGTDWNQALTGTEVVIHAAARAHIIKDEVQDPLAEYRKVNVEGTLNLATQAAQVGVRRFIFVSSIGVNGNLSSRPFTETDTPCPAEPYAKSKSEAEKGLWDIHRQTGIDVVIIRSPLVYGPNAPGNFNSLVRWIDRGLPLPLGSIHNKRSLVALDNLVDLIITCVDHPAAANQVFLAGDGHDVSTTELLRGVGQAMGKPARLIPVPAGMLMFGASLLGEQVVAQRLLGSLQVDISKARNVLGWEPPLSVEEGLRRCFVSESVS
ncbi:SDR family oxidoreductase [Halomonas sp. BLK-85]